MEDFDRLVRSTMENGTEEVPAGLWEAVQSRVPSASGKSRVIPVWFWSAGAGLAAAAAVTLAVIFSGRSIPESPVDIIPSGENTLAETIVEPKVREENRLAVQETASSQVAEVSSFVPSAVSPSATFDIVEDSEEAAPTSEDTAEDVAGEVGKENKTIDNYTDIQPASEKAAIESAQATQADPFEEMDRAERAAAGRKTGVALTVFGDAVSNTNPNGKGSAGPMRVSATVPTKTSITETGESNFLMPLSVGTGVKFLFNHRVSVGVGVNFSYLQRTYAGTYREFNEDGYEVMAESFSDILNRQFYVGIPVNAYISIISNKYVDFYAYAGGAAEKCVSNKHYMKTPTSDITHAARTGGVLFNAGAGLGCEFIIADAVGIYIDPSVRYYFKGNAPKSIRTKQPLMAGIEAGIRIRL